MVKYQLVLRQADDEIILEENKDKEAIEYMYKWYINKIKFFNGTFGIEEREVY